MSRQPVSEWLKAPRTTIVAQLLAQENVVWTGACFHAQQAGEEYLKALLLHGRIRPERTHDLSTLLRTLPKSGIALAGLDADCELSRLRTRAWKVSDGRRASSRAHPFSSQHRLVVGGLATTPRGSG